MNRRDAHELIDQAIQALLEHEGDLLELNVTERALAHHLAAYMAANVAPPISVDCEYNRHLGYPKRLNLPPRYALGHEPRSTTVFPDIIVHERNSDSHNYVVLELKKPGENLQYDEAKLSAFKSELGYLHAAHLILGLDSGGNLIRETLNNSRF